MLNIQEIREIIKLIDDSSIDEFVYESNGTSMTLKKETLKNAGIASAPQVAAPAAQAIDQLPRAEETRIQESAPQQPVPADAPAAIDYDFEIVSPMVGTLYRAASPESDSFVNVGTKVNKNTTVCIVEAMKLFNEIEAEVEGEIVEILAEDGELVEFGQPLFRVKTK